SASVMSRCAGKLPQGHDRSAPSAGLSGSIAEIGYVRCAGQDSAHGLALYADAAAVDNPERLESRVARLFEVGFHDLLYVARGDGVEVEDVGDGNADRLIGVHG